MSRGKATEISLRGDGVFAAKPRPEGVERVPRDQHLVSEGMAGPEGRKLHAKVRKALALLEKKGQKKVRTTLMMLSKALSKYDRTKGS
jgi:hypothetical protein